ncbi:histidine kinase [Bradyrhizobium sp. AUGA SZCCT0240]|uniref:sensor histidine kinase n=1 Tax=unclassified Bradyrhizobium TaxID=2631580 RepID=UPI001BAE0DF0|nr:MULTISPECIES: ATP-binding protein [unclassified Bradyrhizobium]MBR1194947.1 histidine kinase [Bradyrhizobium sp. AUGA SZCCT0158]MBR1242722.1 histidine kinase [Bradyrhizobium sp. AUGA SZCCT0274]MBR1252856.1 histidine kinase [Bradyrhizobium sp. AUGA SZCCT0240]
MSEDAAIEAPPGEVRRRLQGSRLLQYVLLQLLIAIACGFILRQPLPAPPENYAVTEFRLRQGDTERSVTLPHFASARSPADDQPTYTGRFTFPAEQPPRAWSIYLPRFTNAAEVAVNGVVVLDTRRDPVANRPDRSTPQIAVIPSALLHGGSNELTIRVLVWGPISAFLDTPYVGPDNVVRPYYDRRALLFVTLPIVFSAWQAILAVILTIMWVMRRHEPAYGMLAAAMAVGVLQAFLSTPLDESRYATLNSIAIASAPLESGLVLAFGILFFGRKWPRWGLIIFAPSVTLAVAGLVGGQASVRSLYLFIGTPTVGLCLVMMALISGNAVLRRQDAASILLGCAVTIVLTSWIHDMLSVLQIVPDRRIFFSRLSYSAMLVAIGAALTWRFARALNQVDSFAGRLVTQVREAEDKLKASFAREEERARAAALARERTRLMRDLHDGLGGQLVSIVALSERGNDASAGIGDAARAALKDLRLVIDSMDDIGGDLMLALGSWRERAMAQLRPHDIELDWQITPPGLPVHPELRPWHVIQIMRLLDEALTNAVKHARARRITVSIETRRDAPDLDQGCITIADDGKGFALAADGAAPAEGAKAGRGLRNMRSRAARCGAGLDLISGAGGTRVRLTLPHRFPDSDANG